LSSYIVPLFDQLKALAFDNLPATFGVHHVELADPWHLGPELARDIEGELQDGREFLNALVVSPLPTDVGELDAQETGQTWTVHWDVFFIYKRGPNLRQVAEGWADPLHDILGQRQLRRLGNLTGMRNSRGVKSAHVTGFRVAGPPDFYRETENGALYGEGMACFTIPLEVEVLVQLDPETRSIA